MSRSVRVPILLLCLAAAAPATAGEQVPETVEIPAGPFVAGSDQAERDYGYELDERAYGHARTRDCLLYTSPSPRDQRGSRMPSSA